MDVFALRNRLVHDYGTYIQSFITFLDPNIRRYIEQQLESGALWPDPLIQLNPSFEPGKWIDELVATETLHKLCKDIFRIKLVGETDKPIRKVVIAIEEARKFLSAERIRQMPVISQQVGRIARQGRKRWLGLMLMCPT